VGRTQVQFWDFVETFSRCTVSSSGSSKHSRNEEQEVNDELFLPLSYQILLQTGEYMRFLRFCAHNLSA
jgi:hypothetical protein